MWAIIRFVPDVYSSDSSTVSSPCPQKFLRRFTSSFTAAGFSLTCLQLIENGPIYIHPKGCTQGIENNITQLFFLLHYLNRSNKNMKISYLPPS